MFDALVGRVFTRAGDELTEMKAAQVEAHADNARLFRAVAEILLDASIPAEDVRAAVFRCVSREDLGRVVDESKALDRAETENLVDLLGDRFPYIRTFVPEVLGSLRFVPTRADDELAAGIETLRAMGNDRRRKVPPGAPVGFVPRRWSTIVTGPAGVNRRAWELALVSEMRAALRAGDLIVEGSRRYTRLDAGLYAPDAWGARRESWFGERGLPPDGAAFLAALKEEVHEVTLAVADRLPANLHLKARGEPSPRHVAATRPALFAATWSPRRPTSAWPPCPGPRGSLTASWHGCTTGASGRRRCVRRSPPFCAT